MEIGMYGKDESIHYTFTKVLGRGGHSSNKTEEPIRTEPKKNSVWFHRISGRCLVE